MFAVTIRRLATIGVMATVLLVAYPVSAGDFSNGAEPVGASDTTLQEELRFREAFGLTTDLAVVRELMANPAAYTTYPVALSPEERAEMDRRIAMEAQMTPLEEAAEVLPGFAGHWIDQPAGGIIMVAYTGEAAKHEVALRALVPPGATMRVVNVERTQAELESLANRIWADRHDLARSGDQLGHLRIKLATNRVVVGVRDLTAASEAALHQRYGDGVAVELSNPGPTGCSTRDNCYGPPLRAGVSGSFGCSIAFLVRHPASGNRGWLTAGHCASVGQVWYHAGQYHYGDQAWRIGDIMANCWPGCWYSDAARADICCTALVSKIVFKVGNPAGRNVAGIQDDQFDDEGDYVCLNARMAISWRCGYIDSFGTMTFDGGVYFLEQVFANYTLYAGDSGGAVHSAEILPTYSVVAYGVQSGCTNLQGGVCYGLATYSHIDRVTQELGVQVCSNVIVC